MSDRIDEFVAAQCVSSVCTWCEQPSVVLVSWWPSGIVTLDRPERVHVVASCLAHSGVLSSVYSISLHSKTPDDPPTGP